jgi:diacylglycerol kinase
VLLLLRAEHNAKIHLAGTIVVCALGTALQISRLEWCWLVIAITIVWTAEALNSALEHLADATSPAIHPTTGRAKDIAAGAVLLASIGALVIGLLVLGPHVARWMRS